MLVLAMEFSRDERRDAPGKRNRPTNRRFAGTESSAER
jgi:hypothetical protein